jgi:hypothetical protein
VANIQLPALPQGVGGPDAAQLVLAINDRLRRISTALQQIDTATAAAPPASGTSTGGDAGDDAALATWLADGAPIVPDTAAREIRDVIANIPLPSTLNVGDTGLIFTATDYMHRWRFDGTQWAFLEGDASGYVVIGQGLDSTPPNGGLWGLCDGSGYNVAQPDGTLKTVPTIPMNADVFITGGAYTGINSATSPTWAAGAQTDTEAAHTHGYGVPTTSVAPGTGTLETVGDGGSFETGPGSAHSHTLSGATLNPPTVANGGLPKYIGVQFYIRR